MRVRILNQFYCFSRNGSIRKYSKEKEVGKSFEVTLDEVRRFMIQALEKAGAPKLEAEKQAGLLLYADEVGHLSHGLNRLPLYIQDMERGSTKPKASPEVLQESPCTAWVDGKDALGATTSHFCMNICNCKAEKTGVGVVACKGGNHFGMAGYWALQAEEVGYIGFAASNSSPLLVPTRGKNAILGTNPIAMSAPGMKEDYFLAEMAATTVALGKIEIAVHQGAKIPDGWAMDKDGHVTTDPHIAFEARRLLPLGGLEHTSGHKGYALAAMVEIICSGLAGSNSTHNIRSWSKAKGGASANLGFFFVSLDPGRFAPGFLDRVNDCLQTWRNTEPIDPERPVVAPGDLERGRREKTLKHGKIIYSKSQINSANKLAKRIGICCIDAQAI